jgi:hypothetical protein
MVPVGHKLHIGPLRNGLCPWCHGLHGEGHNAQWAGPVDPLQVPRCWWLFQHHLRMPLWPHPNLCELKTNTFLLKRINKVIPMHVNTAYMCWEAAKTETLSIFLILTWWHDLLFFPRYLYQGTTIVLWIPLIVLSVVQLVFSFRCFALCTSSLYLCPCHKRPRNAKRVSHATRVVHPTHMETGAVWSFRVEAAPVGIIYLWMTCRNHDLHFSK